MGDKLIEIHNGALNVVKLYTKWYVKYEKDNFGAFVNFTGIVRSEDDIDGLSFDLYEPILNKWFDEWQKKANEVNAKILMAHSRGDVFLHESSYMCVVMSPKRKIALKLINDFVEDFKDSAPIWKYDMKNTEKIYAKERSTKIDGAGLLK